jgi:hypothetical protein
MGASSVARRRQSRGSVKGSTGWGEGLHGLGEGLDCIAEAVEGVGEGLDGMGRRDRWVSVRESTPPASVRFSGITLPIGGERWRNDEVDGSGSVR